MNLEDIFKRELSPSDKVITIAGALADGGPYEIASERNEENVLSFILYKDGTPLHYTIGNNFAQNLVEKLNIEIPTIEWSDRIDTDPDPATKTTRIVVNLNDLP